MPQTIESSVGSPRPAPVAARDPDSIAVVGAGPGGLAVAMLLAARGARVRIYEAQAEIGGRTGRIQEHGFTFDRGPTFFLMPYALDEVFSAAGRRLSDYVDLKRLDPMYRVVVHREGGAPTVVDATQDLDRMRKQLSAIEPGAGERFLKFMQHNGAKLAAMDPILRAPIRSIRDLITPAGLRCAPLIRPTRSVWDLLTEHFRDPALRIAMGFQSKYLGMSPLECPSLFTILPYIEYQFGVWHPVGGCHALMRAMAKVCRELGVEIVTGCPVRAVAFEGRCARGVEVDGENGRVLHPHSHVVLNADAAWALKNLVPGALRRSWSDSRIDGMRYSCSTYMMYLGIEGEVDLPHHTISISERYLDNLRDITGTGTLSHDPSIYVCNPCRTDPTMAPPGRCALYVLLPTPSAAIAPGIAGLAPQMREQALEQVEKRIGVPDLRRRIVFERTTSPADWAASNINFGAVFNFAHTLGQMLHKRPPHRLTDTDNLWLVGGGTHPGSGLPVIFLSARITADLLAQEAGLPARR